MVMTRDEIIREYLEAKAPAKQIGILADQNLCGKKEIVALLMEAGCDVPKIFMPKKKVETPENPAVVIPPAPNRKEQLELVAFDSIKRWLPPQDCSGGDALVFANKVQALFEFLEEVV